MSDIPGKVITLDQLKNLFQEIQRQTRWDMCEPMAWGYFFTSEQRNPLEAARMLLEEEDYRFMNLYLADKNDSETTERWWLHMEKREVHTPESLDQRNDDLYQFAHTQGDIVYDGMDVG